MLLPAEVRAALGRMDYMLSYSLVQFVDAVMRRFFSAGDTLLWAAAAAAATRAHGASVLGETAASVHKIAAMLVAEALFKGLRPPAAADTSLFVVAVAWLASTSAIAVIPVLLAPLADAEVREQITGLALFMYAESAGYLTQDLAVDHVLPALALAALWAAHSYEQAPGAVGTVVRGSGMLATNIVITTLIEPSETASDDALEIAWLVVALIIFENAEKTLDVARELKDYAVWKGSALVAARLAFNGVPWDMIVVGAVMFVGAARLLQVSVTALAASCRYDAVVHLGALVAANGVLGAAGDALRAMPAAFVWIFLLALVNVAHLALRLAAPS